MVSSLAAALMAAWMVVKSLPLPLGPTVQVIDIDVLLGIRPRKMDDALLPSLGMRPDFVGLFEQLPDPAAMCSSCSSASLDASLDVGASGSLEARVLR
jgi:hypothetical protein